MYILRFFSYISPTSCTQYGRRYMWWRPLYEWICRRRRESNLGTRGTYFKVGWPCPLTILTRKTMLPLIWYEIIILRLCRVDLSLWRSEPISSRYLPLALFPLVTNGKKNPSCCQWSQMGQIPFGPSFCLLPLTKGNKIKFE